MPNSPGLLLSTLPALYHTSETLGQLLSIFEAVLYGTDGQDGAASRRWQSLDEVKPLARAIAAIPSLFDAYETPKEFLPWLAQWVALTHLNGLTEERQRQLLAKIVPLYAQRGTSAYLVELLQFFTPDNATVVIDDQLQQGFVVGTARIGLNSRLEAEQPFRFQVNVRVPMPSGSPQDRDAFWTQWEQRLRQVIDLAKPAHTLYELHCQFDDSDNHN